MTRLAVLCLCAVLLAGCGGTTPASGPTVALLTGVTVAGEHARFAFRSAPETVRTRFVPRSQVVEAGSGRLVPIRARAQAFLIVSFSLAATATADTDGVKFSYSGPNRIRPLEAGPIREVVKTGDFESQLDWAIGLDRRRAPVVTRDGASVTVTFGDGP